MRASYRAGVRWIAENDEAGESDPEELRGLVSILLLADLFEKDPEDVVQAVLREKRKLE